MWVFKDRQSVFVELEDFIHTLGHFRFQYYNVDVTIQYNTKTNISIVASTP